jgi:hypothetical protein
VSPYMGGSEFADGVKRTRAQQVDENTQPVGLGVAVYRRPHWERGYSEWQHRTEAFADSEPGRWFPTDEASLAQMRERIAAILNTHPNGATVDAVMRALFGASS